MKEKWTVVAAIACSILILYFCALSKNKAKEAQCDGETQFYASGGRIYACDNYKKPPQGQQQEVPQDFEGG
ncbi:hypothetical protein Herod_00146 [Acinetobacter phage Herod]|nr:hypothetical protein Herod_00146 [Acinetobacter phage Herod]